MLICSKTAYSDGNLNASCQSNDLSFGCIGAVARTNAFYGEGTGPILRDRVTCTGQETRLRDCTFFTPDYYDSHYEDAGVQCLMIGRKMKIYTKII